MSVVLKRIAQLALAVCALMPLIAAAHGNHNPSPTAAASFIGAIAVAPAHCPTDSGRPCGCHGLSCTRVFEPGVIDIAPAVRPLRRSVPASLLVFSTPVAPQSSPLLTFPPRAP